jgi:hypothetical protein
MAKVVDVMAPAGREGRYAAVVVFGSGFTDEHENIPGDDGVTALTRLLLWPSYVRTMCH